MSAPDRPNAYDRKRSGYTVRGKLRNVTDRASMLTAFASYRDLCIKRWPDAVISPTTYK